MTDQHDCVFPEILIEESDGFEHLKAGMMVLTPCLDCGETPLDHMEIMANHVEQFTQTLLSAKPITPLYHWSPTPRRGQINRFGLRPLMRATTSTNDQGWRAPVICFADSPSWGWALSAEMSWTPEGSWDLWQTDVGRITDPVILPSEERLSGIYEVRTEHRVFKRDLWYVGSRVK